MPCKVNGRVFKKITHGRHDNVLACHSERSEESRRCIKE